MSAIAGIVHFNKEQIKIEETHSVMRALEKFPADDIRVWHNEQCFLRMPCTMDYSRVNR